MEIITSVKNSLVKETKNIRDNAIDKIFVEGEKLVLEALNAKLVPDYFLVSKEKQDFIQKFSKYKIFLIEENVLKSLCETKTPQGVIGVFNISFETLKKPSGNFLVLDNIQDPGNLGTIIRSASGTTFNEIYLIDGCNFLNQKVIRSSMGGVFKSKIYKTNKVDFLSLIKDSGVKLYTCSMEGKNIFKTSFKAPIGLVFGNEGNGVSKELRELATDTLSIPMKNGLESLNVAVSSSIIMYYIDNVLHF